MSEITKSVNDHLIMAYQYDNRKNTFHFSGLTLIYFYISGGHDEQTANGEIVFLQPVSNIHRSLQLFVRVFFLIVCVYDQRLHCLVGAGENNTNVLCVQESSSVQDKGLLTEREGERGG